MTNREDKPHKVKTVRGRRPSELEDIVRKLNFYPRSIRLANALCEIGVKLIKENGLYLPLVAYRADLHFIDVSGSVLVAFERSDKKLSWNRIQGLILNRDEKISVEVVTQRKVEVLLRRTPTTSRIFKLGNDYSIESVTRYSLLRLNEPPMTEGRK